jgi:hypothetical protein
MTLGMDSEVGVPPSFNSDTQSVGQGTPFKEMSNQPIEWL